MMAAPAKHEEPLSLRPQIIQGPAMAPSKNVDAEFKAMWNQLQNKLPISPPVPSQPPLSAVISPHAVSEQTNALKKALRISDGASSYPPAKNTEDLSLNWPVCDHLSGSCCKELSIQCQRMNVPFPQIEHVVDVTTEELSCVLHFSGGTDFMGPKCRSKPEALKRVSCLAVKDMLLGKNGKILSQVHGMMVPPRMPIPVMPHPPFPQGIMSMGRPAGPPANAGRRVIIPIMQENPSNVRGSHHIMPVQNLPPNPPQQWCQQGPVDSRNHKNLDNFQSQGNAPRKSTNPFVPLQAQTAAMMKGSVELKPKPAGAHQPPFPQGPRGERWTNNAAPSAFVPSKPSHSGTSSTTGETKSYQQGSAPSHRPRRKRIAANFSKPLDN